jgi:hypothetical protein
LSDGWYCGGYVAGVTKVDLLLVAAGDDWGVVGFVLFNLARQRGQTKIKVGR